MRLFAAIRPPMAVAEAASTVLRAAVAESGTTDLRLVPVEQLHLTLAFYGEVADGVVPELTARIRRAAARSPVTEVGLQEAGAFPRARSAQVLWLGLTDGGEGLRRLADRVAAAGRRAGIDVEERRWRAHLTVARTRRPMDLSLTVKSLDGWSSARWRVDEVELVRSHLGARVRHEVLERYPLLSPP